MKKTREGFGKKLLLAIHQDNSRGKEEKYQKRKNWEKYWQFSGTILECSRGKRRTSSHNNKT